MNIPIPTANLVDQTVATTASFFGSIGNQLTAAGFDLKSWWGVAGFPIIEAFVNYLVRDLGLKKGLAPIAVFICAILLNILLALFLNYSYVFAIETGIATGVITVLYHESTKTS